jgi:hypothetical protein
MDVADVDLDSVLLTHRFGVWELKDDGWRVRCIDNYYANGANDFAWSPGKLSHDTLDDLFAGVKWLNKEMPEKVASIAVSKTDFKSAFKTLIASKNQEWLQYVVLQHPDLGRPVVVKAFTQTFGSIGAGAAWWRVAQALKAILRRRFKLAAFIYVDDVFVLVPAELAKEAENLISLVLTVMLGWQLDPKKTVSGQINDILGAHFVFEQHGIKLGIPELKKKRWLQELCQVLADNRLSQPEAEQWAGRLQWANCHIFLRCARAALRPIIRRQQHQGNDLGLTPRLRQSIFWFIALLKSEFSRWIEYDQLRASSSSGLIIYSDATGGGECAAVACWPNGHVQFCRHSFPKERKKRLQARENQVVAYELWAAAIAILTFVISHNERAKIFVDNQSALQCLIRAYSRVPDLNNIVGGVLHKLSLSINSAFFLFVSSADNLADGPSRGKLGLLQSLGAVEVPPKVPDWHIDSLDWLPDLQ